MPYPLAYRGVSRTRSLETLWSIFVKSNEPVAVQFVRWDPQTGDKLRPAQDWPLHLLRVKAQAGSVGSHHRNPCHKLLVALSLLCQFNSKTTQMRAMCVAP